MKELIEKYLAGGLSEFEGLEVTGSVPVKQEVVNEFIATFLQSMTEEKPAAPAANATPPPVNVMPTPAATKTETSGASKLPIRLLAGMVKKAEVQAVDGKIILHFTVRR